LSERLWKRATRDGDFENAVFFKGGVLAMDDIDAQRFGKRISIIEGVQIRLFPHDRR